MVTVWFGLVKNFVDEKTFFFSPEGHIILNKLFGALLCSFNLLKHCQARNKDISPHTLRRASDIGPDKFLVIMGICNTSQHPSPDVHSHATLLR